MTTLDSLLVKIDASTELLRRELQKGGVAVDSFARNTDRQLGGMGATFSKLGTHMRAALATFGVGFGLTAIVNFTKGAVRAADAIGESARAAGIGAERFQRLSFVFRQNGVEAGEFEAAMRTANTRLGQFINTGAGPAAKAIEQLGLKQRIANGEIRNNEQFVDAVIGALGKVENSAQRAALAAAFFGREAGAKLQDTIGKGTVALNEAAAAATGVFTDETVRKADELGDAWERIAAAAGNWAKSVAVGTAHDASRAMGIEGISGPTEQEQLDALRRQRGQAPIEGEESLADWSRRIADIDAQIAAIEAQIAARSKFTTGGRFGIGIDNGAGLGQPDDGLDFISGKLNTMPAGMLNFDFAAASAESLNSQLQEVSGALVQMPEDLQKLSPELNSFIAALNQPLQDLNSDAAQVAESIGQDFKSAFAGWLTGVDRDFKDLLKRMAAEMLTSAVFKTLAGTFANSTTGVGKFFGAFFGGARAKGGPMERGKGYLINEGDPELFWPGMSGSMVPVGAGGHSGGTVVEQHFHVQAGLPPQWAVQTGLVARMAAQAAYDATTKKNRGER